MGVLQERMQQINRGVGTAADLVRPALPWLAMIGGGFLCGRAQFLDGLMPFGAPFVLVSALTGWPSLGALIGVCLGILSMGFNILNAAVLVPPLLCWFAAMAIRRGGRELSFGWGALLLMAARLVYLPMKPFLLYYAMLFAVESGLALSAYYCMASTLRSWREGEAMLEAGPLVCLAVCVGIAVAGMPAWELFSPRHFVAIFATLLAAGAGGVAVGATGGLAIGLVVALGSGTSTLLCAALGVCGLLCGVFRPLRRLGMAGGFWIGAVLMSAWATNLSQAAVPWAEALAASAAFVLLPARLWPWLDERLNQSQADSQSREARLGRMRETAVSRLHDFSRCLDELSSVFAETASGSSEAWEDVAPMLEAVASEVCQRCSKREKCWQLEFYTTYGHFLKALAAPGNRRVLLESDFPQEFRDDCRQFGAIVSSLRTAWGLYRVKTGYRRRIDESRALAGKQLKGIAAVLEQLASQLNLQIRVKEDAAALVREALRSAGFVCKSVSVQQGRSWGLTVNLTVRPCGGRRKCRNLEEILTQALGKPMRRTASPCNPTETACNLTFTQARAMRVSCAGAQHAREGAVCGDSCVWDSLDDASYLMAISDGMGTGARAAMESQATLSLLQRFYQAGFSEEVIYDTINQVMLLRSGGETFSTVDLCILNLVDGEANFIKIGAPPTFLVRNGQVQHIASPTLPLGILDSVSPGATRRVLEDGDLIVMVSDGITANEEADWVDAALLEWADLEPFQLSERLVQAAQERFGPSDDMTVVSARVRLPRLAAEGEPGARKKLRRWKARIVGSDA